MPKPYQRIGGQSREENGRAPSGPPRQEESRNWLRNLFASGLLLFAGGGITYTTTTLTDNGPCEAAQALVLDENWNNALPEATKRVMIEEAAAKLRTCVNE